MLQIDDKIIHVEFKTRLYSKPPIPYRMLKYWVLLYGQYWCDIEQVVVFLKPTNSELVFEDEFQHGNTRHPYRSIRMWEQDPNRFLADPALLPFAPLTRSDSPLTLLEQVAAEVAKIKQADRSPSKSLNLYGGTCRFAA